MDVLLAVARAVDALEPQRPLVAIDGPDAAGKTTLGARLAALVQRPVVLASVDGWHHPRRLRVQRGDLSPEGYYRDSFDYPALSEGLLVPFARGAAEVLTAGFDHRQDVPVEVRRAVEPDAALLLDGVFLLRPELRARWHLTVYLHVSEETILSRAVERDREQFASQEALVTRYEQRYLPGQRLYRQEAAPMAAADIVLDNTDPARPVVLHWRTPTA